MPDPTLIVSWPQAIVAITIILALSIVPSVLGWLNSRETREVTRKVKATLTTNNGGSHVKDSLDRIERDLGAVKNQVTDVANRLTTHEARAEQWENEASERIEELEGRKRWWNR